MAVLWIQVGKFDDIPLRGARCVKIGDMTVAVFRTVDDQVFALEDKCPHRGGPLSQGIVHGCKVTCPLHNWVLDLKTGEAVGPDEGRAATLPAKVEQGRVYIAHDAKTASAPSGANDYQDALGS